MGYVAKTLAPGERVLTQARFNWTYSVGPFLWFLVGIVPIFWVAFVHLTTGDVPGQGQWLYILGAVPAFAGIWLLLAHEIELITTEIAVTTTRFVYKTGLISRDTKEVSLNKIEEINLQQSIWGRIFNYGHMILRGTGVGVITLPDVDNPVQLRRTIEGAKAQLRGSGDDSQMTDAPDDSTADDRRTKAPLSAPPRLAPQQR
ncbi:PH domain-containing protein [Parvularcula sp. LCG005]|uniref:PH domain-containing protein n=1 Tax=Parvularcula sp. LCG005 TaxID=3078805 RepID=UPI002942EFCC|nr:PH domain-containing protein [Parvularcula sp. LCG005]WOI53712.1 PH domain-containing protein [Parvularcula sp. LCG005]